MHFFYRDSNFSALRHRLHSIEDDVAYNLIQLAFIRLDGVALIPAINAVLSVMPIDDFVEQAIFRSTFRQERDTLEPVHHEIIACCARHEPDRVVVPLVGADFYNRVRAAHTLVQTSEPRLYANVILRKGALPPPTQN